MRRVFVVPAEVFLASGLNSGSVAAGALGTPAPVEGDFIVVEHTRVVAPKDITQQMGLAWQRNTAGSPPVVATVPAGNGSVSLDPGYYHVSCADLPPVPATAEVSHTVHHPAVDHWTGRAHFIISVQGRGNKAFYPAGSWGAQNIPARSPNTTSDGKGGIWVNGYCDYVMDFAVSDQTPDTTYALARLAVQSVLGSQSGQGPTAVANKVQVDLQARSGPHGANVTDVVHNPTPAWDEKIVDKPAVAGQPAKAVNPTSYTVNGKTIRFAAPAYTLVVESRATYQIPSPTPVSIRSLLHTYTDPRTIYKVGANGALVQVDSIHLTNNSDLTNNFLSDSAYRNNIVGAPITGPEVYVYDGASWLRTKDHLAISNGTDWYRA